MATFLQISDLHLGAPFGWLPAALRDERRREQRRVLQDAVRLATERGVDAILIPGDLFDSEGVDADTLSFAVSALGAENAPPVFIAPGNHDPASDASPYWSTRLLDARGLAWSERVHVFTSPVWSSHALENGVTVWGRAFSAGVESTERPLGGTPEVGEGVHVAIFHGSREGGCPPGQKIAGPFSDDEVHRSPFAYAAVGHYHTRSEIAGENGVRLAYAGSTAAVEMREAGSHGALLVRVEFGEGPVRVETEALALDPRRVHELRIDVEGLMSAEQAEDRAVQALDAAGARSNDFATLRFHGRIGRGVHLGSAGAVLRSRIAHVRLDVRGVRPDYDLDAYRNRLIETTEDQFVNALLDRLDRETDAEERAVLENALDYGLDAFRLREVVPVHEEMES